MCVDSMIGVTASSADETMVAVNLGLVSPCGPLAKLLTLYVTNVYTVPGKPSKPVSSKPNDTELSFEATTVQFLAS